LVLLKRAGRPRPAARCAVTGTAELQPRRRCGQPAIVGIFLPLAYYLPNTHIYRHFVLLAGSMLFILRASVWLVERLFDLKLQGL
jgi:hypothetical protein